MSKATIVFDLAPDTDLFIEYGDFVIEHRLAPANLCRTISDKLTYGQAINANRIFSITGNTTTEIKNRSMIQKHLYISDEDKMILYLTATTL